MPFGCAARIEQLLGDILGSVSFLQRYFSAFRGIEGWFQTDAALTFMAYNQILARHGVAGHTLEIGVHHGLSAICIASLRGRERLFYAIDLFDELQSQNISHSGAGERAVFERNIERLFPDTSFLRTIARASADVVPSDLGSGFSFCHVDGGHSREETQRDLALCAAVLLPGGIVALDDYFNPEYPGVSEGVRRAAAPCHRLSQSPVSKIARQLRFAWRIRRGVSDDAVEACPVLGLPRLAVRGAAMRVL
jgi:predicted O-methyltransferase YrrM